MRILLCVAGMPCAEKTVALTGEIARATGASVTMLHVLRRGVPRECGQQVLEAAREVIPDLEVTTRLRRGDPAGRILAEIREDAYDLVAVGANRRPDLARRLLGSVSTQIVARAPISVLIGRPKRRGVKRVLICTGGLDIAEPVIQVGAWLAEATGARATLLHVLGPVPEMYAGLEEFQETLPELLRTDTPIARHLRNGAGILTQHRLKAELRIRQGVAAEEILLEAREGDYDLVVVGASETAGRLRRWLLGDVTRQVADAAPCSVLVVKGRLFATTPGAAGRGHSAGAAEPGATSGRRSED
ncbi:MAG TPA: universal stress protein [Thermoflexia bacterium]|jgi:nucleotide-binding universal stress UspA family protein|nr:universal stress protein [Thermoflexia bacterium]